MGWHARIGGDSAIRPPSIREGGNVSSKSRIGIDASHGGGPGRRIVNALAAGILGLAVSVAGAASLEFFVNGASDYDFGRQIAIPPGFGAGEFTLEVWIRPNTGFPTGPTSGGSGQRENWSTADNAPYSSSSWWYEGNFLLDGHNNSDFSSGTFSLQFYGSGRVRWLFGDGTSPPGSGGLWSVGAFPATSSATLLDGLWHQLTLVRRCPGPSTPARLELWLDGVIVAATDLTACVNMRQWWDSWSGFPGNQQGWFWGAEKQAAVGILSQYEDYKGLVDELRFWARAKTSQEIQTGFAAPVTGSEPGLVGRFGFNQLQGLSTCDSLSAARCIQLTATSARPDPAMWSAVNAPLSGAGDSQPPTVPTGLQANAVSPSRVDLTWTASTDNVAVAGYRVRRNGAVVGTPSGTTFSDTGVSPNTSYSYSVTAFDAAGNESAASAAVNVTTPAAPDTQAPTVPGGLRTTSVTAGRVDLAWNAATDNVGVTGYRIRRNGALLGTSSALAFSDTGVSAATSYTYTVTAFDAAGNESAPSAALAVTTPSATDTQAPSVPADLRATSVTTNRVELAWSASTDNVAVTGYRVRRGGTVIGTATATSFADTGLAPNTAYAYTVAAFDAAGNESSPSTALNVITQAVQPPPGGGGGGGGGGSTGWLELLCLLGMAAARLRGRD